ncbi:MAG: hypothetical protein UV60_C0024G0008 [Parcubacteria group bacterium GW2011_GWA2_43_11]|nr:MAG: hypothetical protein UV60_C0024G0008 [Parcubacteria group bacterium GW2011_GWA2_43_11]
MSQHTYTLHSTQGFTLFGLLLYIALTATALTALGELTIGVLTLSARAEHDRSNVYTLAFLQARIGYDIGRAESILAPTPGNPTTSLSLTHDGDTTTYYVDEGRLWIQNASSSPEALTTEDVVISSSTFEAMSSLTPKPSIRMTVQTGIYDPLRPDILIQYTPTVLTWYPYAYN